jgi:phospholipid/cholesterol/gamma-HCH transport system permease protein
MKKAKDVDRKKVAPVGNDPRQVDYFRGLVLGFGGYTQFMGRFFKTLVTGPFEFRQIVRHIDDLGAMSLPLITIINFIMGLILSMQSRPTLAKFGAESFLPAMVTASIVRELGPVITALIVAGRVASGIGAELASMKVTEQIEAMETSGVDPFAYLVSTRIIALCVLMPVLTCYAIFIGIFGSYLAEFIATSSPMRFYYSQVIDSLYFQDFLPGVLKTIPFGFVIALIGCYKGFNAESGTEGVGRATTGAVVLASLWIILIDMVLVKVTVTYFSEG